MLRQRFRSALHTVLAAALLLAVPGATTAAAAPEKDGPTRATIRYTEYGVPHILADNYTDLGYGYGYAIAKDNICLLADSFLTVAGERSRYHGPGGSGNDTLSAATTNLNSDLHFRRIIDSGVVERLAGQSAPLGPRTEVKQLIDGYAQGFNRYLAQTGRDGITDPACKGAPWVRDIGPTDLYRLFYALSTIGSSGALADGIVTAQPGSTARPPAADARTAARFAEGLGAPGSGALGSNGIGIGSQGASGAKSVLLGNPHFPWRGANRFWQVQLTVPGKLDVTGAGLLGTPVVEKGYNADVAWTHTLATPRTFGLYAIHPAPGDPTSYLVDGVKEKMTSRTVTVQVRQDDGSIGEVHRTLYETRYGPMVSAAAGIGLPWNDTTGHALRDANATNLRGLNTWFGFGLAKSTADIKKTLTDTQGAPWVNTIAVDRAGQALYADIQVVPHVTDDQADRCGTDLGHQIFPKTGVPVLDGSKAACAWGSDPDALEPGLFGPSRMPSLTRDDYVLNSNDSAWLANLKAPLTGYPRIIGDIGTARTLRTRESLTSVQEGLKNGGFSRASMQRMLFADRSRFAELAAADTAAMCRAFPDGKAPSSSGPVDVAAGCAALAAWDHTYTTHTRGSMLFQRFALKLEERKVALWRQPFDAADPVATPNTLDTGAAAVQQAFGDAAAELHTAGIPLDAELGAHQYALRGGEKIPMPGAPEALGVLNLIKGQWDPAAGNTDVRTGSSYIQVVAFGDGPCPDAATLVAPSQSADPTSPHHSDQTKLFSEGRWATGRYCEKDILASPDLKIVELS
ncbi:MULTISPECIES: penicillin acylase family protein [Streptomyces]|uniref:Penicillin acylase family protein n=1 Tax=Streptomyces ramulosus TaxID=47762 RepID=A0ABW1FEN2_9ACTN